MCLAFDLAKKFVERQSCTGPSTFQERKHEVGPAQPRPAGVYADEDFEDFIDRSKSRAMATTTADAMRMRNLCSSFTRIAVE